MQSFSGEAMAHDGRIRAHLSRMESSPIRRVRQRTDAGHGTVSPANVSFFPLFSMPRRIIQQGKTNTAMRERGNRPAMTHIEPSRATVDMQRRKMYRTTKGILLPLCSGQRRGSGDHQNPHRGRRGLRPLSPGEHYAHRGGAEGKRARSVSSRPIIPKAKARTAREEVCENDYEEEEEEEVPLEMEGEERCRTHHTSR